MAESAPNGTSGNTEAPVENGQGLDYERSYNEIRPQFTRATQDLAEHRERLSEYEQLFDSLHDPDPDVKRRAFDALGLEFEDGPSGGTPAPDEFVDPLEQEIEALRGTVEELTRARELETQQQEDQRLTALRDDFIGDAIGFIEAERIKTGAATDKFTEKEETALGNLAIAMEDDEGIPDVEGAYNLLYGEDGVLEINRGRWIDTKTGAPQAPLGRTIPTDKKPQTRQERIHYMDERWRALNGQA
jgi:hypothetical protein